MVAFVCMRSPGGLLLIVLSVLSLVTGARALHASEFEALEISRNIQLHMPYGTILDPVFASSDPASPRYADIVSYTRLRTRRSGRATIWPRKPSGIKPCGRRKPSAMRGGPC